MILMTLAAPMLAAALASSAGASSTVAQAQDNWIVYAERVYTSEGEVLENAAVHIAGGKITAIEAGREAPEGERVLRAAAITTGMIDASARITTGAYSVEQSEEVQPQWHATDSLDLFDPQWLRLARTGVTAAVISPMDMDIIGGLSAVLKTSGPKTLEARTVAKGVALRGAIGGSPSVGNRPSSGPPQDFYRRRPTTRMGVEYGWRTALWDAAISTRLPERAYPGSEIVVRALAGELPVFIDAWTTQDIRTAVFLKEEMQREGLGTINLIIDSAAEAWKDPQLLTRSGTSVILPPFSGAGRSGPERAFMAWNNGKTLRELGVTVALSAHGSTSTSANLARQAGYAMRGGMSFEDVLAAVTIVPARLFGVADRLGSIAIGKDGDIVMWSGKPFEATSRVIGVLARGELIVDPR